MNNAKTINWRKACIDIICLVIVILSVVMFYIWVAPYQRGFFCNDESLKYPFKRSTITKWILYTCGSVPHILTIFVGEYFHWRLADEKSCSVLNECSPYWLGMVYSKITNFIFGMFATFITTDIAKYVIGRPRPHFMEVCQPNINCSLPENRHVYFDTFECGAKNATPEVLKQLRSSFPSGQASFSAFVMVWIVIYLQVRISSTNGLMKNLLQLVCLMTAWYSAMSTVSSYNHHWTDVLAGMGLGTLIAVITAYCVEDMFKEPKDSADRSEPDHPEGIHSEGIHSEGIHSINPRSVDYPMEPRRKHAHHMGVAMTTGHDDHRH